MNRRNVRTMEPASATRPTGRAMALLAVLMLLWGTNWPLFHIVLQELPLKLRGESLSVPRGVWLPLLAASALNICLWNITTALAVLYIPSGHAAMLAYTMPLWTGLISVLLFGEQSSARMWLALALGAVSVTLLMWPNFAIYAGAPLAIPSGLLAGLVWALGTITVKRTDWQGMRLALTAWQVILALPPIALGAMLIDGPVMPEASWQVWATTVYIGLVPMAFGTATWFTIVSLLPMQAAAFSSITVPLVAMVSGSVLLGEPFGPAQVVATVCAAGALGLALRPSPLRVAV
jgi:drug/metabolite transporter (DMT)-like permease